MSLHSTIKDSPITHGYLFVSRKAHMPYGAGARSQHNITINDWDLHWIWFMYVYNSHRALFTHKHISVGLLYYVVTCYNESVLALLCFFFFCCYYSLRRIAHVHVEMNQFCFVQYMKGHVGFFFASQTLIKISYFWVFLFPWCHLYFYAIVNDRWIRIGTEIQLHDSIH